MPCIGVGAGPPKPNSCSVDGCFFNSIEISIQSVASYSIGFHKARKAVTYLPECECHVLDSGKGSTMSTPTRVSALLRGAWFFPGDVMTLARSGQSLRNSVTHRYRCGNLASKTFTDSSNSLHFTKYSTVTLIAAEWGGARNSCMRNRRGFRVYNGIHFQI